MKLRPKTNGKDYTPMKKNKKALANPKLAIARAKARQANKAVETPEVIPLPDGTAEEAAAVIATSDIPEGPTTPITQSESEALMEAATDPAKALSEPAATSVPVTEGEMAAETILEAAAEEVDEFSLTDHPADVLFAQREDPPEDVFANFTFNAVHEMAENTLLFFGNIGKAIAKFANQIKLRTIAFGNDAKDKVYMIGNKMWAAYDYHKKNPQWFYAWLVRRREALVSWAESTLAEWRELRQVRHTDSLRELSQYILDMQDTIEKEMKAMHSRMAAMEKAFRKEARAHNRAKPVDPDQLIEFANAIKQGRRGKATELFRAITGATIDAAKQAVESVPA